MAVETKAERLSRLVDEVVNDIGNGTLNEAKWQRLRVLWRLTPDREKDGLSVTLKDIEQLVRDLRRELSATGGKVQRVPVEHVNPNTDSAWD